MLHLQIVYSASIESACTNPTKNDKFAEFRDQMGARLDRHENTSSQLAAKLSSQETKIEDLAQRVATEEKTSTASAPLAARDQVRTRFSSARSSALGIEMTLGSEIRLNC